MNHSLIEAPVQVEILDAENSHDPAMGARETARLAFPDAERRLSVASRTIGQHLDKRFEAGFADILKQAADLNEQDKSDILNRHDAAKVDFAARQSALQERLTTAFQHLALNDIAAVSEALACSADAIAGASGCGPGSR